MFGRGTVQEHEVHRAVGRAGEQAGDMGRVGIAVLGEEHVQQVVPPQLVELIEKQRQVAEPPPVPLGALLRHPRKNLGERWLAGQLARGVVVADVPLERVHLTEGIVGDPPRILGAVHDAHRHDRPAPRRMDHGEPHCLDERIDPVGHHVAGERWGLVQLGAQPRAAGEVVQHAHLQLLVERRERVMRLLPIEAERLAERASGAATHRHQDVGLRIFLVLQDQEVVASLVFPATVECGRERLVHRRDAIVATGLVFGLPWRPAPPRSR